MRVALYYAPLPDDPLTAASTAWLGRDPASGAPAAQPDFPGIAEVTAEPRLYGFHATLKPPFHLKDGVDWFNFATAVRDAASRIEPFDLPPLAVTDLRGFLALTETYPCLPLHALADACVAELDAFRAPPSEEELARRRSNLSPQQDAMLTRWAYPYVFETWFFHMTLTRRLREEEKSLWIPRASRFFATPLRAPRRVSDICLFTQTETGASFTIAERIALRQ